MAQATTLRFGKGILYQGDAATPTEAFTAICGVTQVELKLDKDINSIVIPDCSDPDAAAWVGAEVASQSWNLSASGVMAKESYPELEECALAAISRNFKLRLVGFGTGSGTPDRMYAGAGHVTLSITGERGGRWEVQVDISGDGALTATNVAAA
jgi:Phage tail tube protein